MVEKRANSKSQTGDAYDGRGDLHEQVVGIEISHQFSALDYMIPLISFYGRHSC